MYPSIIKQFSPDWIGKKKFDFCIPEHNIIIELDGLQHFEDVKYFKTSFEDNHINDKEKEELATEHNYCVIRLLQNDVFYDTYDWFGELLENIQIIINEKPTIQNIYMDKNDEYECFL
jgi:very-short-patch-repair endonuclease